MNSQKPILYFSNLCNFCNQLLVDLKQKNKLQDIILQDVKQVQIPPYVQKVPTLVLQTNCGNSLLVGKDVFDYFQKQSSNSVTPITMGGGSSGIAEYDPCSMGGFSDNFCHLDSSTPMSHAFVFVDENMNYVNGTNMPNPNQSGGLPSEPGFSQSNNSRGESQKKKDLDKAYSDFMAQRSASTPMPIARM